MRALLAGAGDALTFGTWLQQNRTLRELSREEVARETRLPARIIASLEQGDRAVLRDHGYALLAARSCALAIGLDADEAALRLTEELQGPAAASARPRLARRIFALAPREPLVWLVLALTVAVCAALLLRG